MNSSGATEYQRFRRIVLAFVTDDYAEELVAELGEEGIIKKKEVRIWYIILKYC